MAIKLIRKLWEVQMIRSKLPLILSAVFIVVLVFTCAGCFSNNTSTGTTSAAPSSVVKPKPQVEGVVATTSGTQTAYYATLDIKVKNVGAEGTILVQASITQGGRASANEMPVFLKQNETHELKLTFPLVWGGGEFTSNVVTIVP
jgi:hypothetical protein